MKITISLGQFDVIKGEPDHNLERVSVWIETAAERKSNLVVFPELWDTGYALDQAAKLGSTIDKGRFSQIAMLAQKHQIHVVGSMMEYDVEQRAFNTLVWFTPDGEQAGIYRKVHLFRLMDEDQYLQGGDAVRTVDAPWGMTGLAICYDLRFPELFRGYALSGVVMTIIPAQWPHPRCSHWQTLLQARAIENQMVVVACNRVGNEGNATFCGRSAIYDAWGETIIEAGEEDALLTAEVDLDHVAEVRRTIPVFEDRRPEIYHSGVGENTPSI